MKNVLFSILQCTWGIIQTFIGLICFILSINCKHYYYNGVIVTDWKFNRYVSLGLFVFVSRNIVNDKEKYERMRYHEYGHTIQSAFLGPLYPLVIMLPSLIWCGVPYFERYRKRKGMSYYDFFSEKWADRLGKKHSSPRGTLSNANPRFAFFCARNAAQIFARLCRPKERVPRGGEKAQKIAFFSINQQNSPRYLYALKKNQKKLKIFAKILEIRVIICYNILVVQKGLYIIYRMLNCATVYTRSKAKTAKPKLYQEENPNGKEILLSFL